ncbi:SnoaL-like protein [Alteromonadaceae bacterium 2753L.S.0a.02]|nr:SnoaL-like protein [Alteromonadaceae bacterium 2753L.S.0a.02]
MSVGPHSNAQALVESFKAFYRDVANLRLDDLPALYHSAVVFKDPVHEIRGINALHAYMSDVCSNVSRGRFEYLDQLIDEHRAYIKWNMHFCHKSLGNKAVVVRGISQIEFNDKIFYHEDVYDMGELLYEHLPVLGSATQWLKRRMSAGVKYRDSQ